MKGIDGKTALVTGAGSGIGRATSKRFADAGTNVVVTDIDEDRGTETVDQIKDNGGDAIFVEADVTDAEDVQRMVDQTVETYGSLDFAHNNAGLLTGFSDVADVPTEDWELNMAVHLRGVWECMKAELPVMEEQGGGAIVNTASNAGIMGVPGLTPYAASKHGVVGLTKTAALEYATRGIRINAVAPGATITNVHEAAGEDGLDREGLEFDAMGIADVPMDRIADPEEQAGPVVFLCSSDASFITGHILAVDGGKAAE